MSYNTVPNWNSVPDATHYCPETYENWPCYYKQDEAGAWMGKLDHSDEWDYNITWDQHTQDNLIAK